jgi:regulator of CtrA degradation
MVQASYRSNPQNIVRLNRPFMPADPFKLLFREGMDLVEAAAAYLGGPGKLEARALPRGLALAYATESMRLTTRMTHLTSWLLQTRAVHEGELSAAQTIHAKQKIRLICQPLASPQDVFEDLPRGLCDLCNQSLSLQSKIARMDELGREKAKEPPPSAVRLQFDRLRDAFTQPPV